MTAQNALLIVIDALRFDALEDIANRPSVAPNLARLARNGFVRKATANGQTTQFALPSIFSQTYPLDHGGYNNGILNRPRSFVEQIKDAGYANHILAGCLQIGVGETGYERGFDVNANAFDYRTLIEQRISRTVKHDLDLWQRNEITKAEMVETLNRNWIPMLAGIENAVATAPVQYWQPRLRRINFSVAQKCKAERNLLATDPDIVLRKMTTLAPGIYHRFLGYRHVNPISLMLARATASIGWRTRNWQGNPNAPQLHFRSQFQATAGEIFSAVTKFLMNAPPEPWFVYAHVMDVHDCNFFDRPMQFLKRMWYLPTWLSNRAKGWTRRHWLYDTALLYVDTRIGNLLGALEATGNADNTLIVVTGDHGLHFAESPRSITPDIGDRFYYEDLDVPILVCGTDRSASGSGLYDSRSVSATLLDALQIDGHRSFKGRSVFEAGLDCVITENAGRGNADLKRRDLFFAVTTERFKLMVVLEGKTIRPRRLFDRQADPKELVNLVDDPEFQPAIQELTGLLWRERHSIFEARGVEACNDSNSSSRAAE